MKYTKEILEEAARESYSVREVMRRVGANPSANSLATHLSNQIKKFEIDTSHFTGQGHQRGKKSLNRRSTADIFIRLPVDAVREKSHVLRRALLEGGRVYVCEVCERNEWNDKPLGLEVDHKDGDRLNNLEDNLRFLCPNCHSQV